MHYQVLVPVPIITGVRQTHLVAPYFFWRTCCAEHWLRWVWSWFSIRSLGHSHRKPVISNDNQNQNGLGHGFQRIYTLHASAKYFGQSQRLAFPIVHWVSNCYKHVNESLHCKTIRLGWTNSLKNRVRPHSQKYLFSVWCFQLFVFVQQITLFFFAFCEVFWPECFTLIITKPPHCFEKEVARNKVAKYRPQTIDPPHKWKPRT